MVRRVLTASLYTVGIFLFFIGAAPLLRWIGKRNPKVLLYHDCAHRESDYVAGLECTTSPENFSEHIAYLSRHYRIVPLDTILSGNAPSRAVSITFDDGYASVYDNAFPILRARQLPATIYLISSVIDNRALVWVNELNCLVRRGGMAAAECVARFFDISPGAKPAEIITACRINFSASKVGALLVELRRMINLPEAEHARQAKLYLTWEQIREMAQARIEFGNHSQTHPNMECLTEEQQLAELQGAQKELEEHLPQVRHFAHPFGHRGPTTASLASKSGLLSAADVGGYNYPVNPLKVGRTHMANESVAGLFARMEVVEPVKGLLRRREQQAK